LKKNCQNHPGTMVFLTRLNIDLFSCTWMLMWAHHQHIGRLFLGQYPLATSNPHIFSLIKCLCNENVEWSPQPTKIDTILGVIVTSLLFGLGIFMMFSKLTLRVVFTLLNMSLTFLMKHSPIPMSCFKQLKQKYP